MRLASGVAAAFFIVSAEAQRVKLKHEKALRVRRFLAGSPEELVGEPMLGLCRSACTRRIWRAAIARDLGPNGAQGLNFDLVAPSATTSASRCP